MDFWQQLQAFVFEASGHCLAPSLTYTWLTEDSCDLCQRDCVPKMKNPFYCTNK
jgi:hypothetical protein